MFEINGYEISITRGDRATIELSLEDKTLFEKGDKIRFAVYKKRKLNEKPVLEKIINVEEQSETVDIELSSEETTIGELSNRIKTYWYEIEYNDDITIVGFDEETGAKLFKILPEGKE